MKKKQRKLNNINDFCVLPQIAGVDIQLICKE